MRYSFAGLTLDLAQHTLAHGTATVPVEPKVFDLIHLLVRRSGQLVTRDEMVAEVWGGRIVSESAISACIAAARRAVGDDGKRQAIIRTVPRRGLMLAVAAQTATPPPAAQTPQLKYLPAKAGRALAWTVSGTGPPLMKVDAPGWSIEAEATSPPWRAVSDTLAQHYTLVQHSVLDLGHHAPGPARIDFDAMAEDILAVADAAGLGRFALMSQSGGVHPGLRFAVRHPDRVSHLIILGGYCEGRTQRDGSDTQNESLRKLVDESWRTQLEGLAAAFVLAYLPEGPLDAIRHSAANFQGAVSKEAELALRDAINEVDNGPLLPHITCPTLIVHARHDAVHPLGEAHKLAAGIADADLLVLDTGNHLPMPSNPTWPVFFARLRRFLDTPA